VNPAARHLEHNWSKRCFDGEPKPEELTAPALSIDHPNDGREHFAVRLNSNRKPVSIAYRAVAAATTPGKS
jgi:hypothetical protein